MQQTCILILGMHRSGTSALAGVLDLLGISMGNELLQANADNPKGYFENQNISTFNEWKILSTLNSSWDDVNIFEKNWQNSESIQPLYSEAKKIILNDYKDKNIFGIKDPRMCILFPFWEKIFKDLHISIKIIIPLRFPHEVHDSLLKRNNFKENKSLLLWSKYLLYAEFYSRPYKRVFVEYDNLLIKPRASLQRIENFLLLHFSLTKKMQDIKIFLNKDLKHNNEKKQNLNNVPDFIKNSIECLYLLSQNNENIEYKNSLDTSRSKYEQYVSFFYLRGNNSQNCEDLQKKYDEQKILVQEMLKHEKSLKDGINAQSSVIKNYEHTVHEMSLHTQSLKDGINAQSSVIKNYEHTVHEMSLHIQSLNTEMQKKVRVMEFQEIQINDLKQELNNIKNKKSYKIINYFIS